jgi:hypothetical protein
MLTVARLWRRGQQGWPARFPVAQFPNVALLVYLVAVLVRRESATLHDPAWAISQVALTIWAFEELVHGANWFRRVLGAVVLAGVVVGLTSVA